MREGKAGRLTYAVASVGWFRRLGRFDPVWCRPERDNFGVEAPVRDLGETDVHSVGYIIEEFIEDQILNLRRTSGRIDEDLTNRAHCERAHRFLATIVLSERFITYVRRKRHWTTKHKYCRDRRRAITLFGEDDVPL